MSSVIPLGILVALVALLTLVVLVVVVLVVVRASTDSSGGRPQRRAPLPAGTGADERLRVEASAVLATSGWHTAEAFLREQRGLTPEAARAVLDSLA